MDKHRLSLILIAVLAVGTVLGGWFLGIQPQLDRAAVADEQTRSVQQLNITQQRKNTQLAEDAKNLDALRAQLSGAQANIPPTRSQQALINQLDGLAGSAGVRIASLTFEQPAPYAPPAGVPVAIPGSGTMVRVGMSVTAAGDRQALERFAAGVQAMQRIITIADSQYTGPEEPTLTLSGALWALVPAPAAPAPAAPASDKAPAAGADG